MQVEKVTDYTSLVTECFSSDPEYIAYHWAAEKGLKACIEITVEELSECFNYSLYRVIENDKTVAMFGVENKEVLNPFFIKPEGRRKEVVGPLLEEIKCRLNKNYIIGVYDRNEPIKRFMLKNGAEIKKSGILRGQLLHILQFNDGKL